MKKIIVTLFISLFVTPWGVAAQDRPEVATLDSAEGTVEGKQLGETEYKAVAVGQVFKAMDTIHTTKKSRAGLLFVDGVLLRLAENTTLQFQQKQDASGQGSLQMDSGKGYFFSRDDHQFPSINTPAVSTAIRGTEFVLEVSDKRTIVSVLEGSVECSNAQGRVLLGKGEQAVTDFGKAPVKGILLNPYDAVQWALYYPPIVSFEEMKGYDSSLSSVEGAISRGATGEALAILERPAKNPTAARALLQSSLYLSLGMVPEATGQLESAERLIGTGTTDREKSLRALLLSQSAVIALTANKKEDARNLVNLAAEQSPNNASVRLSKAYVDQSFFDLESAKNELQALLRNQPKNAFGFARLAELELAFNNVEAATAHVDHAIELAPENTYALTVRGFVRLIRDETEEALQDFDAAIGHDASLALSHLGRGLALIRRGDLEQGRIAIERAASFAPTTALYRSYLGKALYEEEKNELAGNEYDRAMALDPNDPTPYLYRAFLGLTTNRPVAALQDVEKSIALNDNRAVYRSRLLLDQDRGVRGAALSEVFNALGFAEVARVEAIKSINSSYSNYSAHRLLSDSYRTIVLNDAAISEKKIANLLAPLSFNLFRDAGGDASINDYNALFDRSETRTELGMTAGTQGDLVNPTASFSGKGDKVGYLVGYESAYTDGTRHNDYSYRYRGNIAGQYQPTYRDRLSLNAMLLSDKTVDHLGAYDEVEFDQYNFDFGYNRQLTPNSKLIAQATFDNQRNGFLDNFTDRILALEDVSRGVVSESELDALIDEFSRERVKSGRISAQHIYDSSFISTVIGTQLYWSSNDREESSAIIDDSLGLFADIDYSLHSHGYNNLHSHDFYGYSSLHLQKWVDLNLGGSFSEIELEQREIPPFFTDTVGRSRFNPKVGLTFYPTSTTTIRTAYFEALRKTSLDDSVTLEPTLVGGINQRFTDFAGDRTQNYGAGIDQKFSTGTYVGVEALHRDIISDIRSARSQVILDYDDLSVSDTVLNLENLEEHKDVDSLKGYAYQVLTDRITATVDYENISAERFLDEAPQDIDLNKVTTGLRYFDPTGWFTFGTATWRQQKRDGGDFIEDGTNDFWVVDAGVGYRLRNRHGSIVLRFNNILDEDFTYDQSPGFEEFIAPEFGATLVARVNF